jgi:Tfp pilus assembly protein PilW
MSTVETYYQMEEIKENLEEEDETPNEAKLQNWGMQVDRYLDQKLMWLFDNDLTVFPLTSSTWVNNGFTSNEMTKLQELATAGLEAKFWEKTNADYEGWKNWKAEVDEWIKTLTQIPATTENG